MHVVLLGPPGAGKGTQAQRIRERFGVRHVSTGSMFRDAARRNDELGQTVKPYLESGGLVPDELVIRVVLARLGEPDCADGWMLDGFPRTVPQAEALDEALAAGGESLDKVLLIAVDDAEIVGRLSGRRVCAACGESFHVEFVPPKVEGVCDGCGGRLEQRVDDRPEAIERRLEKYHRDTAPLIPYYDRRGVLVRVEGTSRTPDEVSEQVREAMQP